MSVHTAMFMTNAVVTCTKDKKNGAEMPSYLFMNGNQEKGEGGWGRGVRMMFT